MCQELELASAQNPAIGLFGRLVLDASNVYWLDGLDRSIRRVGKNGGNAVQTLIPNPTGEVETFAVAGNQIFWGVSTSFLGGSLTAGLPSQLAVSTEGNVVNTGVAGNFVYWMVSSGSVFRRPLAAAPGTGSESLHTETQFQGPDWMRALGTCVYYSMGNPAFGGSRLRRVCAGGVGAEDLFVTNATSIEGFDADGSGAYVVLGFNAGETSISRVPLAPQQAVVTLFRSSASMLGLALDGDSIYFVEADNDAIWRIPKSGGAKSVFADPVFRGAVPDSLTTDGAAVYWVDGGSLYKKAR